MKRRAAKRAFDTRNRGELIAQIVSTSVARTRSSSKACRAGDSHIDCCRSDHQSLIGTNVGSGLRTPDMLLAGLQCERIATSAIDIDGCSSNAPWHLSHMFLATTHETEVRSSARQRNTQRLSVTYRDVDASMLLSPHAGRF